MEKTLSLSLTEAERIISQDNVPCRHHRFNRDQVVDAVSVWFALLQDHGVDVGLIRSLKRYMISVGLTTVFAQCDAYAKVVLSKLETRINLDWEKIALEFVATNVTPVAFTLRRITEDQVSRGNFSVPITNEEFIDEPSPWLGVSVILEICSFLKRFTYIGATDAVEDSLDGFVASNEDCRQYAYDWKRWPGPTVLALARQEARHVFPTKRPKELLGSFSNGTNSDLPKGAAPTLLQKLYVYRKYTTCYAGDVRYPIPEGAANWLPINVPVLMSVPKSMDTRRIIAPETVMRVFSAHGALDALRNSTKAAGAYIHEHAADFNRDLARKASDPACEEDYATIDLHAASDSIGRDIFAAVVPPATWNFIYPYLSWWVEVPAVGAKPKRVKKLFTLLTSGNPLTWYLEACWFLTLARVGCILSGMTPREARRACYAYGDDLEVPTSAYETVCDVLELFGHTVNRSKSYCFGRFRESCGGWYVDGFDVTPNWWPRHPFDPRDKVNYILSLCELQHKLYNYPNARQYLESRVLELYPKMTYSPVKEECSDLWGEVGDYESEEQGHIVPYIRYDKDELLIKPDLTLYEHWLYYRFLTTGPAYDSELDRLLGVTAPLRAAGDLSKGELALKKAKRLSGSYGKNW